jgi:hypothetical protein
MEGWPSQSIFDHNYQIISLDQTEFEFLQACDSHNGHAAAQPQASVADLLSQSGASLEEVRQMQQRQLILLKPSQQT